VDEVPHQPQRGGSLIEPPEEQPELHHRPDFVQPERCNAQY
jgi:hypothetical protein